MENGKIINLRICVHDIEECSVDEDELTDFIIDILNENFTKDYITFEKIL